MRPVRSERGSMPMAMLAIMIVGSLLTVLVGTVVTGQRQTRFDQGFEQSLQLAEVGLERMTELIRSRRRTGDFSLPEVVVPSGRYQGAADRTGRSWVLTATGSADGTTRTISVTVTMRSLFGVAAFGRTLVELRGNNSADSYRSGTFNQPSSFSVLANGSRICHGVSVADPFSAAHSTSSRMCVPTGKGVVATNAELYLLGQVVNGVDRAEIHYAREGVAAPLDGATGFCGGVTETCGSSRLAYYVDPIELEPDPVVPPDDLVNLGSFSGERLPAGRQLYTNVTLGTDTVVEGTPENPTIVYLTGTLNVPNAAVVNFRSENGRWVPKPAPGLLIFSAGSGPALRFGNHVSFSGAVYAPRATFAGGAAGNIYGSVVTGSISTQGSWNFHYDEALGDVETEARHVASDWAEVSS